MQAHDIFLKQALSLAYQNVSSHGQPFGAVIVQANQVVSTAMNEIHLNQDPTAHAELLAIRRASKKLNRTDLTDCTVYASGQPCPMCLALIYMTGIQNVFYAYSNEEGADFGLSTSHIYQQMRQPISEQKIRIEYLPIRLDDQEDLYELWTKTHQHRVD